MIDDVLVLHDRTVLVCDADGPPIDGVQGALDVIGQAWGHEADMVVIPVSRLDDSFFTLSTGVAGDVMQKFANYQLPLAVIGSIAHQAGASSALRALVSESNRGAQVWFLDSLDQLAERLSGSR